MKAHLSFAPDGEIVIMVRAEGPGGLIGDMVQSVRPGAGFGSKTYVELVALGPGVYDWALFEPFPQRDD
jgi:hypothetical protein